MTYDGNQYLSTILLNQWKNLYLFYKFSLNRNSVRQLSLTILTTTMAIKAANANPKENHTA